MQRRERAGLPVAIDKVFDMSVAVVIGSTGGIGSALTAALSSDGRYSRVLGFARTSRPSIDLTDEPSIERAARTLGDLGDLRLVIDATGIQSDERMHPEKALRLLDPADMVRSYAINTIGPALLMKHFLPLLPRDGRSVFATLSAKVGSIADNRLGGWFSYRASKAALNQIVRTAAIELARTRPHAICVAIHPGTVDTRLSRPFAKRGLDVLSTEQVAKGLLAGLETLRPADSGGFFNRHGRAIPW